MCFYEEIEKVIWAEELKATDESSACYPYLAKLARRAAAEYSNAIRFINSAQDDYTRQILRLRRIEHKEYFKIGLQFGLSADCVRMIYKRQKARFERQQADEIG